jgi:hypothetical protein
MRLSLNTLAVCLGVFCVIVYGGFTLGTWSAGVDTYTNFLPYATFAWVPFMMILLGFSCWAWWRNGPGEVFPFQSALKFAFIAYIIYELGYALVNILIYNVLDKGYNHTATLARLQKDLNDSAKMGLPLDEIKDSIAKENASPSGPFTFFQILLGFGLGVIIDFLKSMLIGIAVQRLIGMIIHRKAHNA